MLGVNNLLSFEDIMIADLNNRVRSPHSGVSSLMCCSTLEKSTASV